MAIRSILCFNISCRKLLSLVSIFHIIPTSNNLWLKGTLQKPPTVESSQHHKKEHALSMTSTVFWTGNL